MVEKVIKTKEQILERVISMDYLKGICVLSDEDKKFIDNYTLALEWALGRED